jgi:hypothetical protein
MEIPAIAYIYVAVVLGAAGFVWSFNAYFGIDYGHVWHALTRELKDRAGNAAVTVRRDFALSILLTTVGFFSTFGIVLVLLPDPDPPPFLGFVVVLTTVALAVGLFCLIVTVGGFLYEMVKVEKFSSDLGHVLNQKGFGDAGFASESDIHAGLPGRSAGNAPLPEFPD